MKFALIATILATILNFTPLSKQDAAQSTAHNADRNESKNALPCFSGIPAVTGNVECKDPTEKNDLPSKNDEKWVARWGLYINGVLAIATFILAIFAVKQANAAKDSASAAKRSAEAYETTVRLTERADVLLYGVNLEFGQTQRFDPKTRVILHFKNFGRTRANKLRFSFYLEVPDSEKGPTAPLIAIVLGSGDTQILTFSRLREFMTEDTFKDILNNRATLTFEGSATYEDVFDVGHTSRYRGTFSLKRMVFDMDEIEAT